MLKERKKGRKERLKGAFERKNAINDYCCGKVSCAVLQRGKVMIHPAFLIFTKSHHLDQCIIQDRAYPNRCWFGIAYALIPGEHPTAKTMQHADIHPRCCL